MESQTSYDHTSNMVGIIYTDSKTAMNFKSLPPCAARGQRLKLALSRIYQSKKAMYLDLGIQERSLSRWFNGGPIAKPYAEKIAAILIEKESERLARWVFLGIEQRHMTDSTGQTEENAEPPTLNGVEIDIFHAELIRAYRRLGVVERLNLAAQVLGLPTLLEPDSEKDSIGHIDGQALDDHEKALILKLRVIRPAAIAITLISRLINESKAI